MSKFTLPGTILSIVSLASVPALIERGRPLRAAELYPSVTTRSKTEQKIAESLDQAVRGFEFLDTPLTDVTEILGDAHDVQIVIDRRALEDDAVDASIPITQELRGIPLRSALCITLEPLGLTYAIQNDLLVITSPSSPNAYEVRCYNVGPLVRDGRTSDELAAVVSRLHHLAWPIQTARRGGLAEEGFGGFVGIDSYRHVATFGNLLIVRDTEAGHQHVAKLLASLREGLQSDARSASTQKGAVTAQRRKKSARFSRRGAKADDPFAADPFAPTEEP